MMGTGGFFGLGFSTWSMGAIRLQVLKRPLTPPWVCLGVHFWVLSPAKGDRKGWPCGLEGTLKAQGALFPVPSEPRRKARRITIPVCPGLDGGERVSGVWNQDGWSS